MDTDRKDTNIQIGKRLREARRNMNIDKAEIAEVLGGTVEHYRKFEAGTTEKTVILLAITRLLLPKVLLPATTALASIDSNGRNEGLRAGANVIMPNLSPMGVRKKYSLYNNKAFILDEDAEYRQSIEKKLNEAGFVLEEGRGDNPDWR